MADNISFTGTIPEAYDRYLGPLLFEHHAKDLTERIGNKKITSVLELASGTGRLTKHLSKILGKAKIVATDLNPDMLEIAKKKVSGDNIEWKQTDMQEITFDDSVFDLVICQFGVMFVPDKVKAFKEIYRVLKPGGIFLFNTWDSFKNNEFALHTHEIINSFFKDDPVNFYQVPFSYFKEDEIRRELNEGGFKNISISVLSTEGESRSAADAAKGLIEGNPSLISINERNPDLVSVIQDQLSKTLSEKFGDNPMKCPMKAFVIEAVK